MKHIYRFFAQRCLSSESEISNLWKIQDDELHHLVKVLRLQEDDIVEVFDGNGNYAKAQIIESDFRKFALCKALESGCENPSKTSIALCLGALKNQNLEELLPSIIELGVDQIHIFMQNNLAKYRISEKNQKRWEKIILSSCKQCKRNFLPKLRVWPSLLKMIEATSGFKHRIWLSPESHVQLYDMIMNRTTVQVVVGSEKGLDKSEEILLEKNGFQKYLLGQNILRSVTAAISSLVILSSKRYSWEKSNKEYQK